MFANSILQTKRERKKENKMKKKERKCFCDELSLGFDINYRLVFTRAINATYIDSFLESFLYQFFRVNKLKLLTLNAMQINLLCRL